MWYLSSSCKLLSENPQDPPEKIQSPLFIHFSPKNSKKCKSPLCANIENFSDPPCRKGGVNYGCVTLGDPPPPPPPPVLPSQELIQKEKDINGEKSGEINIVAKETKTGDSRLWLWNPSKLHITTTLMFFLLCSYVIDMIKKLELCLLVVAIFFKIGFAHAQISMPKISTIMLKIACINPCFHHPLFFLKIFV